MTQSPPAWSMVFIGGGTLLVGSITLLTKSILDRKEEQLRLQKDLYSAEKERAEQERAKFSSTLDEVRAILRDLESSKLDPVSAIKLREAIKIVDELPGSLTKLSDDCRKAAIWLRSNKGRWVKEASKESIKRHPKLIPILKRKAFSEDIANYLEWVCDCLERGGTRTLPLTNYVDTPSISLAEPYISAIEHISSKEEWLGLTYQQKEVVQSVLIRLTELIHKKFNHSFTSS